MRAPIGARARVGAAGARGRGPVRSGAGGARGGGVLARHRGGAADRRRIRRRPERGAAAARLTGNARRTAADPQRHDPPDRASARGVDAGRGAARAAPRGVARSRPARRDDPHRARPSRRGRPGDHPPAPGRVRGGVRGAVGRAGRGPRDGRQPTPASAAAAAVSSPTMGRSRPAWTPRFRRSGACCSATRSAWRMTPHSESPGGFSLESSIGRVPAIETMPEAGRVVRTVGSADRVVGAARAGRRDLRGGWPAGRAAARRSRRLPGLHPAVRSARRHVRHPSGRPRRRARRRGAVPVGRGLLGRVVDALGRPLDGQPLRPGRTATRCSRAR